MLETPFQQIAAVLALAVGLAIVASRLRQPLILGFIAAGILVGPEILGLVTDAEPLELLAEIGIAVLLFIVGLKLDLHLMRTLGPVALITGLGQVASTAVAGYAIAQVMGIDTVASLYIAVGLAFSSTIMIVKLLSDRGDLEQLHGRIALGVLIVQDIVVVLVMITVTAFADAGDGGLAREMVVVVLRGIVFLAAVLATMRWLLPPVLHRIAHTPEQLILFSLAWAIAVAAAGDALGFSNEVGAFLAGVALASTPYREAISGRLVPLRDFTLLFFFVDLGISLDLGQTTAQLGRALVLSLFVLVGKPVIIIAIMGALGYRKRTSFTSGSALGQISEFSLILGSLGVAVGHIGDATLGLITTIGLITIGLSTYVITYAERLYEAFEPVLGVFERSRPKEIVLPGRELAPEVIVIGLGRLGGAIVERLLAAGADVVGIDYDPQALRRWSREGVPTLYGDAEDPDLPSLLPLHDARWVVISVRSLDAGMALLRTLRLADFSGSVAAAADRPADAQRLRDAGVDLVLLPFMDTAATYVGRLVGDRSGDS